MSANCITSISVGCIVCCHGCSPYKLINSLTFLPPPPSYTVNEEESGLGPAKLTYLSETLKTFSFYQEAAQHAEVHFVTTSRREKIALVWVKGRMSEASSPEGAVPKNRSLVILHCHGNATDIGMMMGPYFELTKQLGVEVVGVEYSGYGCSTGSPSAPNTHADIDAAYKYLVGMGVPPELIVVYGQSVGSGPAVGLASKRQVGGLILHSPLMSGIKVIDPQPDRCCKPSCVYHCFDFFPNDKRIKSTTAPVFIIHGQVDDIVPFDHGRKLFQNTPQQHRWPAYFPKGAGHNDVVERDAQQYFTEVATFLRGVARSVGLEGSIKGPTILGKPAQMDMNAGVIDDEQPTNLPYAEPIVGPEDRRYNQLRGEKVNHADKGAANELHPVLTANNNGANGAEVTGAARTKG